MRRVEAVAVGDVQKVGYRDAVQRVARKLGITGYVQNLKPYDVKIVAEGSRERLEVFLERIRINRFPIYVEELRVEWKDATGEFEYFEIRRGPWEEELGERLDFAASLLFGMIERQEEHIGLTKEVLRKQDEHIELTKEILKKQDEHIDLTKEILRKQDEHIDLTKEILDKEEEHIDLTRDLHSETKRISARQEEELEVLKDMDAKLGSISRAEVEIKKLREEFRHLKEAIRKAGIDV